MSTFIGSLNPWILHAKGFVDHPSVFVNIKNGYKCHIGRDKWSYVMIKNLRFSLFIGPNTHQFLSSKRGPMHAIVNIHIRERAVDAERIYFGITDRNASRNDVPGRNMVGFGWHGSGGLITSFWNIKGKLPNFAWSKDICVCLQIDPENKKICGMRKNRVGGWCEVKEIDDVTFPEEYYFALGAYLCSSNEEFDVELITGGCGWLSKETFGQTVENYYLESTSEIAV